MAKALYRKYRPKKLSDVIGQKQVTEILSNSLAQGKISHAYLFIGPRGTGKTSVARIFAHEVNSFKYDLEESPVDIIEIDGASNRGIDNIRELREKALIAPTSGKYKVYIIDEVHMLTKEAFNALLKILEEPPKHIIFIMATTDAYKVPVTITSRAQTYTFSLADNETMLSFLRSVAEKEKVKIEDEALSLIVKRGGGSFRDSLSLLDQIATLSSELITKEMVTSAMGLPEDEKIIELLETYLANDIVKITTVLKDLLSSGIKPETLAEEMIAFIVENPKPEYFTLLEKLPEVKAPFADAKLLVALARVADNVFSRNNLRFSSPETHIPDSAEKVGSGKDMSDRTRAKNGSFDWDKFVERVKGLNDAVAAQLLKCKYKFENEVLEIYPPQKIIKTILSRDNNKRILVDASGEIKININEVAKNQSKDATITKLSDIMGGEVKNDTGGNPF